MLVTLQDIAGVAGRFQDSVHVTPIMTSSEFNRRVGREVFFKCENLQNCGAFKIRGAVNAVKILLEKKPETKSVVTHSSGNFGAALAHAATENGLRCLVVATENAPVTKIDAMRRYGANVVRCTNSENARKAKTSEIIAETGATFIHSSNQLEVIAGQGTVGLEICEQLSHFDAVLVPLGGGGLCSGVAVAVKSLRPDCLVFGVEPELADDAKRSFDAKRLIPNESYLATQCDGLRASLGDITFKHILQNVDDILLVSDDEVWEAQKFLFTQMKLCVEPSGAVGAAALMTPDVIQHLPDHIQTVVVVLSGGNWTCPGINPPDLH